MPSPWLLTTPSSRGIGLALTRHLLRNTTLPVVATARKDLDQARESILQNLPNVDETRLSVLKLDVLNETSIADAAASCSSRFPAKDNYLHLAFLVPGILHPERSPSAVDASHARDTLLTNTLGPLLLAKHFSPFLPTKSISLASPPASNLPEQAVMAMMSARVGSISDNSLGGWYSYRASKAGVNQLAKTLDIYLKQKSGEKAMCVALHPGTVRTGLSKEFWGNVKEEKLFDKEWVAERLVDVVKNVGVEGRGKCWDWKGEEVPP